MSGGQFLEQYLRECRDVRRSGSGVPEGSHYLALGNLLNGVGASLRPKVKCMLFPSHGAGIPDFGLFTPDQFQRGAGEEPIKGTKPARGVVEVKPASGDAFMTAPPPFARVRGGNA